MNLRQLTIGAGLALLAACSGPQGEGEVQSDSADLRTFDVAESAAPPPPPGAAAPQPQGQVAVATPRIAYTYGYAFRLPAAAVARVQERHLDLCERMGPQRCRVVNMERSAESGDYVRASLKLQVAAPQARSFGRLLVETATEAGADTVDRAISAEDLSKQMVDTEARIRTREALIGRLTELLETRSGNIQQAVEAERAINNAQEELEAARGWLAEMQTRVAMSTFDIAYESGAPTAGALGNPVREAFGRVGELFGQSVAILIIAVAALLPWALLLASVLWLRRVALRRGWIGKRARRAEASGDQQGAEASPVSRSAADDPARS